MQPRKKPTRNHRIDRDPPINHIEDDTGHLWAVSYADFLMVLLSFFILFFSVNDQEKDVIVDIISSVKERGLGEGLGGVNNPTDIAPRRSPTDIVRDIEKELGQINIKFEEKSSSVVFDLQDDIYGLGSTRLSSVGQQSVKNLMDLLKPYQNEIDVVFVGHTDQLPVRSNRSRYLSSNFDLSALRASRAVSFAMGHGFPRERLFTHGAAFNVRDTKSLSVIVRPRGRGSL